MVEKVRELAKKHSRATMIVPVVAYPADAQTIGTYKDLQEELQVQLGTCKLIEL